MKEFYLREWSQAEKVLFPLAALLTGIVWGFLIAPVKKGVYCGNHNGNNYDGRKKAKELSDQ